MHRHRRYSPTRLDVLSELDPFIGCSRRQLRLVDSLSTSLQVPGGTCLALEGTPGRQCFLVEQGAVRVTAGGRELDVVRAGRFVGEMALLYGGLRAASATTATDVTVLVFNPAEFATMLAELPLVAARVRGEAVRRREVQAATTVPVAMGGR